MLFSDYHVWIQPIHPDIVRLGLSEEMQKNLGKILHVDLPSVGSRCSEGEILVIMESSKSAIEILSPVSGEVIDINQILIEDTAAINSSPEEDGWLVVVRLNEALEIGKFLKKDSLN
ncbi:glycine cleavage protein H-like protein [Chlamydia sp. 17-3921]|uniref:glycine cleavage protein H-like protein n=1 Tax=Chlamydia sp. 17-3921 TaxID=2675798 RepID=UPI001917E4DE|nr:glycine cleavage protein H-like protein [Chlamydia sp. 17-3921]